MNVDYEEKFLKEQKAKDNVKKFANIANYFVK